MARRSGLIVAGMMLGALACGRTDVLWLADSYADEGTATGDTSDETTDTATTIGDGDTTTTTTTTTGDGDGDGDGDPTTGDGDGDPTTGDGDGDPTTGDGDGDPCMNVVIDLSPDPTTVIFLVDQGAHMDGNFGNLTRLEAIGEALFDMQGVAWTWESQRRLGLVAFTSFNGDFGGECPVLEVELPDLMSATAMQTTYAGLAPEDENPVADAIQAAVPLFDGQPGRLILITGRNPDTCAQPNPQFGVFDAVTAGQDAFVAGVETHVVSVGNVNGTYAQALANVGIGLNPQDQNGAMWSAPGNLDQLRTALDGLVQSYGSCAINLGQPVAPGTEVGCLVDLDGMPVGLGDPDGWSLVGPEQLMLEGAACTTYQQGATPSMTCACP